MAAKQCTCEKPVPVADGPVWIHCRRCQRRLRIDRQTAVREAIARAEETQALSLRAAGYAFFLQDLGFDFEEISEYLDEQQSPAEREVQHAD